MPPKSAIAAAAKRRQIALNLRYAGAGYRAIGQQLGVSHVQAFRDVQQAIDELNANGRKLAERVRDLELERLDRLTLALWPKARTGDDRAIRSLVALMERRARLLGLDAAQKYEHSGHLDLGPVRERLAGLLVALTTARDTGTLPGPPE